jgi:tripartite-type tricarboxylate transporter receptor subunit TctC
MSPFLQTASSQTARTIKIVVPVAAGGVNDTVARLLGDQIHRAQGQTILIENRAGAGGAIGTEAASRAAPDGNTLALASTDIIIPHI